MFMLWVAVFGLFLAAEGDAFKFLAIGDWGVDREPQYDVANAMATWANTNRIEFIVSTADNFYTLGEEPIDNITHRFFNERWRNVYNQPSLRDLTWYMSLGNHDYCFLDFESAHGNCEWVQVEFGAQEPRWHQPYLWYTFYRDTPAGRMHVVVMDTEDFQFDKNNRTEQLNWVRNQFINSQGDFIIVVAHHPIYSGGRYGPDFNIIFDLEELMMQYNISMYLTGHDHNMQHLQYLNGTGPEFVVTGAGGRRLYGNDTPNEELEEVGVRLRHFEHDFGFTEIEVEATALKFSHINRDGRVVYTYSRPLRPAAEKRNQ